MHDVTAIPGMGQWRTVTVVLQMSIKRVVLNAGCCIVLLSACGKAPAPAAPAAAAGATGPADPQRNVMLLPAVSMGGAMVQTAVLCGQTSAAAMAETRAKSAANFAQQGLPAAEFDRAFDQGVASVNTKWQGASPAERLKACEGLKAMASPEVQAQIKAAAGSSGAHGQGSPRN